MANNALLFWGAVRKDEWWVSLSPRTAPSGSHSGQDLRLLLSPRVSKTWLQCAGVEGELEGWSGKHDCEVRYSFVNPLTLRIEMPISQRGGSHVLSTHSGLCNPSFQPFSVPPTRLWCWEPQIWGSKWTMAWESAQWLKESEPAWDWIWAKQVDRAQPWFSQPQMNLKTDFFKRLDWD